MRGEGKKAENKKQNAVMRELHRVEGHNRTGTAGATVQNKTKETQKAQFCNSRLALCTATKRTKCFESQLEGKSVFHPKQLTLKLEMGRESVCER